ncbi:nitrate- and nitrite sensing domain-containing protein [Streptomyces sp. TS71-3]|uniref:sensor histidine kinase n=1 Tax=Streptomyces sp. TS71-3 TaxID=2733862 RepID=UPI001B1F91E4|nr:nitrate- and nitrite sensing domain-containing protein [Streptomyces sp. TS71-3]GHJ39746.1 ATPase [Streptomyces sp. TS71-3]
MRVSRVLAEDRHDHDHGTPPPSGGPGHVLRAPRPPLTGAASLLPGRLRPQSVRAKIVALLMVPVVSLMALWAFATVTTAQSVSDLTRFKDVNATLLKPVGDYVTAVQAERSAAARYLAKPDPARLGTLGARAKTTDAAAAALRRGISASSTDTATLSPDLPSRTRDLISASGKLPELRKRIAAKRATWGDAYTRYTDAIDRGFAVDGGLSGISASVAEQGQGSSIASGARVVQELARAREMISREDAVVGSSGADGRMPGDRYRSFVGAAQSEQTLFQSAVDDLRPSDASAYRAVLAGRDFEQLRSLERVVEDAGPGHAPSGATTATWDQVAGPVLAGLDKAEAGASTAAAKQADPLALDVLGESGIAVVLGLVGVLISLLISMQIGRGLVVELVEMRNSALELAGSKLPQSLRRLHAGEEVDIDAEAPVRRRGEDEIGQVGAALNAVHRAALQAAVERAEVLSGISEVYVKLARRSQVLLHRQLDLLDTMERRVEDPTELEDLFRLDHLTTRMRRHAESLIILSGAAPVRGWRRPVPMLDLVRAAVAEVEDFTRVEVRVAEDVHVAGSAVADLTHLIAELVENAVAFSPPNTKVQVRGERVGAGLALEVEDRGLGMSRQAMDQANRKIVDASQVDLLDTDRLGLFVVNRLAHRRGVQVALKPSVYGGVTAVVLVPETLLEQPPAAGPQDPGGPATMELPPVPGGRGNGRRHAAPAGPLPRQVPPRPTRAPSTPAADPERTRHAVSSGDETILPAHPPQEAPPPGAPVEVVPAWETPFRGTPAVRPAEPSRPGAHDPADAPRPGAAPAEGTAPADGTAPVDRAAPAGDAATSQGAETPAPELPVRNGQSSTGGAPLPKRVRQANIAPELRDAPPRPQRSGPHIADPAATARSPERARATMAALRAGWLRGEQAASDLGHGAGGRTEPAAGEMPGRTPEGNVPPPPARDPGHSEIPSQGDES